MPPEGNTRTGILPSCLSLDRRVWVRTTDLLRWGEMARYLEREFTDWKFGGSSPTSASRLLLSRLEHPGSNPFHVLPSEDMAARHRKCVTSERLSESTQICLKNHQSRTLR
ncbi:hypothetical protein CSKR_105838 [Clonorchis sinensis]|uniref:Uncharacterized protein n=1 Tax=Clonorchis sinensis TaxID=79923 RepID=A0A3R7FMC6_CLOSI|nr:hypothetical protein CSKR_105838 [Clonorchis sinensis]